MASEREIYQHFKGGIYEVIALAKMEATQEECVVYRSIVAGLVWVRPEKEFHEEVERVSTEGEVYKGPRFRLLKQKGDDTDESWATTEAMYRIMGVPEDWIAQVKQSKGVAG